MRRRLRELQLALDAATTCDEWRQIAEEHDEVSGASAWRREARCPLYDHITLQNAIRQMRSLREDGDAVRLAEAVTQASYRHLWELRAPELYEISLLGTKHLVEEFLDEVDRALNWMCDHPVPSIPLEEKLVRFRAAVHNVGHSALMLSGGATWGFAHLGVVKGLLDCDLLPDILSGASTGAMVAAGVCARNDDELREMYANLDDIRLDGLVPVPFLEGLRQGAFLEPGRLSAVLEHNVGDATFAEAWAHSGRSLNIPVSPTRTRQRPRVLNRFTTPEVLIRSAALASSALPLLFPPIELLARDHTGEVVPYIPGERWADGSLSQDLPKLSVSRLHNVNYFIVSQVNPHVLWLVRSQAERGFWPAVSRVVGSTVRTQLTQSVDLFRRASRRAAGPLSQLSDRAYALVSQEYQGDANIHPRFDLQRYRRMIVNPTREDLSAFILAGEQAAWRNEDMIRNQTRISRTLRACVARLEGRMRTSGPDRGETVVGPDT